MFLPVFHLRDMIYLLLILTVPVTRLMPFYLPCCGANFNRGTPERVLTSGRINVPLNLGIVIPGGAQGANYREGPTRKSLPYPWMLKFPFEF